MSSVLRLTFLTALPPCLLDPQTSGEMVRFPSMFFSELKNHLWELWVCVVQRLFHTVYSQTVTHGYFLSLLSQCNA